MLKLQKELLASFKNNLGKINTWDRVHVTDKSQIRTVKVPEKFSELRITSGSTGTPLYVYYSKEAVDSFINRTIISLKKSGVSNNDVVLNLFAYGNYIPGSMYERACHKEGISVIPFGAPNTYPKDKVLEAITRIKPNVWLSIPSYAINLLDTLNEKHNGIGLPNKIIVAGEKLLDSYIKKFKKHNIEVINHFGLTECPAIGVSKKGHPKVIEIINEGIYTESLHENGHSYFVVTDLNNHATPIIRYKTGDVISHVKHNRNGSLAEISIIGRVDDLIKIGGVFVSKIKIIDSMLKFTDDFVIRLKTKRGRDFVEIIVNQKYKKLKEKLEENFALFKKKDILFKKKVPLYKTSSYKCRYIIDLRK